MYLIPLGFVVVPYVVGWGLGWLTAKHPRRMRTLLGVNRAPTAWDQLFGSREADVPARDGKGDLWLTGSGLLLESQEIESLEFIAIPDPSARG